jgi:hypothetical protein
MDDENKKVYFVDFDNTMYLHSNKSSITEWEYKTSNIEYGLGVKIYNEELVNHSLIESLNLVRNDNTIINLLTGCTFNKCLEAKKNIIQKVTDIFMDFFSVPSKDDKVELMRIYSNVYNIPHKNIVLIDDDLDTCIAADSYGFTSYTPEQFQSKYKNS